MFQHVLLLCGEGSLHKWRRGLPCFVERFRRRGAQAAPVWDAACLAVVVSWHRPAAQDVLQRPEDGTCWAEDDMNTERAFQKRWEATQYFSKIFSFKNHNVIMSSTLTLEKYPSTMLFFLFCSLGKPSLQQAVINIQTTSHIWPPSQAVQLGLAGGACIRKLLLASTSLYLGFSTRRRISASRRCRKPGSMAVPPITTRFSESTLRASMGHYRETHAHIFQIRSCT